MKQILLTVLAVAVVTFTTNAQRTLMDFEAAGDAVSLAGVFDAGAGGVAVIANPDATGINTSDSVGHFIEATDGQNWAGFFYDLDSGQAMVDLTNANKEICLDVWMPSGDFSLKLEKVENAMAVFDFEPAPLAPSAYNAWSTICHDYTGTTADGQMINRFVFLFNVGSLPSTALDHYFDNLRKPYTTNTTSLINGEAIKVFPSPATFDLYFDTDGSAKTIIVSDLMGRQLDTYNGYTDNNIRVADYAAGTYIITFVDEATGERASTKFVKQ